MINRSASVQLSGVLGAARKGLQQLLQQPTSFFGLFALAFLLMMSYAISRPATESLFLEIYTRRGLPFAWLLVAGGMLLVVGIYNHFAASSRIIILLVSATVLSAISLVGLLVLARLNVAGSVFALYVWKDIHIVVLVEIFWSIANVVFAVGTARWAYGLFCAAGSLGGIVGNLMVGPIAARIGTINTLWLVVPLLLVVALGTLRFGKILTTPLPTKRMARLGDAVRVIHKSSYLGLIVMLIALTQLVITLIDYVYNGAIQNAFPQTDQRTAVIGWVYAGINFGSLILQLLTGPILRVLGVGRTLLAVPFIIGSAVLGYGLMPLFAMMAAAKVASKAFDYSIFRAAKEILYIPLGYREKVEGKAIADMLTYRFAKGGAAIMLIGLAAVAGDATIMTITVVLIAAWFAVTSVIVRRYRQKVSGPFDNHVRPG